MSMITEQVERLRTLADITKDIADNSTDTVKTLREAADTIEQLAAKVREENPIIHCKDCAYFEYDVVKNVDGIPLIVGHEMCTRWGDGCKTKEDGYCFLFEPQETETWNGIHAQITAPKGTFERIFNDADDDSDI